ncbi:peptidylprolyl isomerase [Psychroflexus lacisalsi]|jgi:peptidylprolyl isomerase|uniref:Peptidyl-prolyl cis-trans isomerase n=1 Tax=Psychroflexus lacisalsi TaxID=503928 RepID=A0ABP3VF51_9FLAO|nr:peptidylprolyl isomerase [Psychroflexus lacisalsi]MBZ9619507.1 peptidylprolyl isomerase [Psychroflexus lacisalsi]
MENGIYAHFNTEKGKIIVQLAFDKTPGTVGNFIGLAEGKIENSAKDLGTPYYNGLVFHRVIDNFMIQGGDPKGNGTGGPGYQFDDEINPDLRHDRSGVLSMANAGPGTNGSQFFITHGATPWLDGKHTVFGYVVEGQDVVDSIEGKDSLNSVEIERIGEEAKAFDAVKSFEKFNSSKAEREAKLKAEAAKRLDEISKGFKETESGLRYQIINEGSGAKPNKGQEVSVHYKGSLVDGTVFDSSYKRKQPIEFPVGAGHVIEGWDEGLLLLNQGTKAQFVIPPHLAYGDREVGGVIPANSILVFDLELVDIK